MTESETRLLLAFSLAPMAAPLSILAMTKGATQSPAFALGSLMLAYAGMFILGLPIYRALTARRLTTIWIAPVTGFLAGTAMGLLFFVVLAILFDQGLAGVLRVLADKASYTGALSPYGVAGAIVGLVFWLIARPDRA